MKKNLFFYVLLLEKKNDLYYLICFKNQLSYFHLLNLFEEKKATFFPIKMWHFLNNHQFLQNTEVVIY